MPFFFRSHSQQRLLEAVGTQRSQRAPERGRRSISLSIVVIVVFALAAGIYLATSDSQAEPAPATAAAAHSSVLP